MTITISLIFISILILISAFFSGCETALTAVSKTRMHALAIEGDKRAEQVNKIREQKERMIGALLLGSNVVNILSSAVATSIMIALFGQAGVLYATAIMTVLLLIFAEVMPKTYALHHADDVAMALARPIWLFILVLSPITSLVAWIVRHSLKLFGADITMVSLGSHMEVLRGAIELHRGPEEETQEQRAMLHSILDLGDVDVGSIMTHRKNVEMIDASEPIEKILEHVLNSQYTRMPVWRDDADNIIGVIHAKSLLKQMQAHSGSLSGISLENVATEPWFVPESTKLFDQLQAFRQRREHFAMVVDEYGSLKGVVTLEDILEEIVGDIDDEMDKTVAGVRKQPNGSYMIDGTVTIRDLNREFDWKLPDDEDYATLAGLILHESKMVPDVGRVFHFYDFTFEVVRRQRNQITLIRVTPPKKEQKEEEAA